MSSLGHISMRGVLVFPSRQIFSVPRFCQQITGAITASRLEGLTSGLRITQTAIPLKRLSLAVSTLNWCRRLDSNQRRESAPGTLRALPTELRLHIVPSGRSRSPAHQEKKGEKKKNGDAELVPAPPRYHIFSYCCISLCNIT